MLSSFSQQHKFLHGSEHPKTRIVPIIPTPLYAKDNNGVFSNMNVSSPFDYKQAGFFQQTQSIHEEIKMQNKARDSKDFIKLDIREDFINPSSRQDFKRCAANISYPSEYQTNRINRRKKQGWSEKEYDKIVTQTIQPDIYAKYTSFQPTNYLNGISYPIKKIKTCFSEDTFKEGKPKNYCTQPKPSYTNVFDPRFSGYGPTDRCFIDREGKERFFYSDINSVLLPSIKKSNIDIKIISPFTKATACGHNTPFTNTLEHPENGQQFYQCVDRNFIRNTNMFRASLQESLMQKRNREMQQLRIAPIHTNSN